MSITVKEIRVVATVVRHPAREEPLAEEVLRRLKREILDELKRTETRNRKKDER